MPNLHSQHYLSRADTLTCSRTVGLPDSTLTNEDTPFASSLFSVFIRGSDVVIRLANIGRPIPIIGGTNSICTGVPESINGISMPSNPRAYTKQCRHLTMSNGRTKQFYEVPI